MPGPTVKPSRSCSACAAISILGLGLLLGGSMGRAQEAAPPSPPEPGIEQKRAALDALVELRIAANREAAKLQEQIDEVADETDALAAQHRTAVKQIESLRQFNDQMRELVASQQAELRSVADQLDRVEEVGRNVTPLMLRMIDALEAFVELDVPFLPHERHQRIADLRAVLSRADVSSATKFRQIMEAYQTENEYGRTIEAYRGEIELDGSGITVDLLRFGRIALVFQTLDGEQSGAWSQERREWERLGQEHGKPIRQGLRIARKLEPPDLIRVPLPPPGKPAAVATEVAEAGP